MGTGLLAIAAAAALRAAAAGTVRVDEADVYGVAGGVVAALVTFGTSALAAGYLAAFSSLRPDRAPWSWRTLVACALGLQVVASLILPLTSNDLFNNILYGHLEAYGGIHAGTVTPDVMQRDPMFPWVGDAWNETPCVYGPVLIAHLRLTTAMSGGTLVGAIVANKIVILGVSLIWVWLCAVWARGFGDEKNRRALFWLVAVHPLWLFEVAGQTHNDGLVAVLVLAAVLLCRNGRLLTASAVLALAAAGKYSAVVPFGFLLVWSLLHSAGGPWRRARVTALAMAVFASTIVLCYVPSWEGWRTVSYPWSFISKPKFIGSLLQFAYGCGSPWGRAASIAVAQWTGRTLTAGLLVLAIVWVRRWRSRPDDPWLPWNAAFQFTLLYLVLATGWFMPWYVVWLLPLVATVRDRRWWAVVAVYGCSALAYQAFDYPTDLVVSGVSTRLRPILLQGPVMVLLVRMWWRLPVVPPDSRWRLVRWIGDAAGMPDRQAGSVVV